MDILRTTETRFVFAQIDEGQPQRVVLTGTGFVYDPQTRDLIDGHVDLVRLFETEADGTGGRLALSYYGPYDMIQPDYLIYDEDLLYGPYVGLFMAATHNLLRPDRQARIDMPGRVTYVLEGPALVTGGPLPDTIVSYVDGAELQGRSGPDILYGRGFAATLTGGIGSDALLLNREAEGGSARGGPGDDILWSSAEGGALFGGAGADLLVHNDSSAALLGGPGADVFVVSVFDESQPMSVVTIRDFDPTEDQLVLQITASYTYMTPEAAFALFQEDARQDGPDLLLSKGEVTLVLRDTDLSEITLAQFHDAGPRLQLDWPPRDVVNDLSGAGGDDLLDGTTRDDSLFGGTGDDTLMGGWGNDTLRGGPGDDVLLDGPGDDVVKGSTGRDLLGGTSGQDRLTGGAGADAFLFYLRPEGTVHFPADEARIGRAVVTDFDPSEDVLWIGSHDNGTYDQARGFQLFTDHARQRGDHVVYDDGLSVVVLRDTALEDLTLDQFYDISNGGYFQWPDG